MARRAPDRDVLPTVQRLRLRYAKRGRLRFSSHRDFQRAFERALRRAEIPMAYSAGFSPHPKISYANAAPTGAASEAEYVEIGVTRELDPVAVRDAVTAAMPEGLDIVDVVVARTPDLVARLEASRWLIRLPGADSVEVESAVRRFLERATAEVTRMTKNGTRVVDARAAVLALTAGEQEGWASLHLTLRHDPSPVRPDDVLTAIADGGPLGQAAILTRLAQGPLCADGSIADPLDPDRG
jgi:radical SAM-linked protein